MNVGEEQVPGLRHVSDLVLDVDGDLEVVLPVLALVAVRRQHRVLVEHPQAVEIKAQPIEDDDVGRDQQEVCREVGILLVAPVKETPGDQQAYDLGLARTRRELHDQRGQSSGNMPAETRPEESYLISA
jgi:hypothetical protein